VKSPLLIRVALRSLVAFVVIVAVGLLLSSNSAQQGRVLWFDFDRDAIRVMNAAGFTMAGVSSMGPEEIPVPLGARLRMMLRFRDRVRLLANELEPTTLRILAPRQGRGEVRCLARYHAGYVAVILLRYPCGLEDEARELKKALHAAYPREIIELEEKPPLP
jgi:hypothetical protein